MVAFVKKVVIFKVLPYLFLILKEMVHVFFKALSCFIDFLEKFSDYSMLIHIIMFSFQDSTHN